MIYPSADKLESWGSKYALVTLAAKRAKQIKSGSPALIDTDSRNPLTIALEEIASGKVTCVVSEADIVISTSIEPEVAQLLAIPEDTEDSARAEAALALSVDDLTLTDEDELEEEEEEEEEHEAWTVDLDEEAEEEVAVELDDDLEAPIVVESDDEDLTKIPDAEPAPKPKRGRKPKAAAVTEDEGIGLDPVDSDEDLETPSDEDEDSF